MITLTIILIAIAIVDFAIYYGRSTSERIVIMIISAITVGVIFWSANVALENKVQKQVAYEIEQQRNLAKEVFGTDQGFNEAWRPQWAR